MYCHPVYFNRNVFVNLQLMPQYTLCCNFSEDGLISCDTPKLEDDRLVDQPLPVYIHSVATNTILAASNTFTYKPNPVIERVEPMDTILGQVLQFYN